MLVSLSIKNIVLIDQLDIPFNKGTTVLTGETGAGKSIILDALGLLLGNRADSRLLRNGAEKGSVSGEFDISKKPRLRKLLQAYDIDAVENSALIRRVMTNDGKSRAYINDVSVGINLLQEISSHLVEIHGQHEQRGLMQPALHMKMLDEYCANSKLLADVSSAFSKLKNLEIELKHEKTKVDRIREEEDYLRHSFDELASLDPQLGEEESLANKRKIGKNRAKILEVLKSSTEGIIGENDISKKLISTSRYLERSSSNVESLFSSLIEVIDKAAFEAENAVEEIEKSILELSNEDAADIEQIEERLFNIRELARKHKKTPNELVELKIDIEKQLNSLESSDNNISKLEGDLKLSKENYIYLSKLLSEARMKAALKLEKAILSELKPLRMEGASFKVNFENLTEENWSSNGVERITFLVKTNPGNEFGPINKIASGGELSRFMLAMRVIFSSTKSVPTLIFDEIDTGTGGATADAVGKRLAILGKNHQVFTITHQAQVAAYGDHHIRVEKVNRNNSVVTNVEILLGKQKKEEVARMLAGAVITNEARAAAKKLMEVE